MGEILGAFYDQAIFYGADLLCILGWERYTGEEAPDLEINCMGETLDVTSLSLIKFSRMDVNKHFGDEDEVKWGVMRVFRLASPFNREDAVDLKFVLKLSSDEKDVEANLSENTAVILNSTMQMDKKDIRTFVTDILDECVKSVLTSPSEGFSAVEQLPGFIRLHGDNNVAIPGYGVFLQGWMVDSESNLLGVYLRQGSSISENLLGSCSNFDRPDVNKAFERIVSSRYKAGIYGIFRMSKYNPTKKTDLVMVAKGGRIAVMPLDVNAGVDDPISLIRTLLTPVDMRKPGYEAEMNGYLGDAIFSVWANKKTCGDTVQVTEYGQLPDEPVCSIIIPIYGRYDFVLYQIAQFVQDPGMCRAEIIYVLDDPRLLSEFNQYCAGVYELFRLPFKTVSYDMNLGFAGANNMGVQYATAPMLLLLNSDVVPKYAGWLAEMMGTYAHAKNPGILGARLLFEDETIQHDGLAYQQIKEFGSLWLVEHPGKGLPVWMTEELGLRSVPSVTGACMLMKTELYSQLGGLDESYVLGDFEDSDLCLKALNAGYVNYINSSIVLYHLERQSQNLFEDKSWKFKLTIYNGLQHTRRWGSMIKELSAEAI
ncbi:glycosyltransferase family 2 protein [Thalassolituus sp. LLYu03]|uniref:glycosyltransferase family 2 protein n=1 Tax=Thalassolituus sp. LLYu03 TaxID=3421656 RepID=UPI003D2C4402